MIDRQKREIRNQIKELKSQVSFEDKRERSVNVFKQIESIPQFIKSETIMLYWSMIDEVQTHDFIQKWANSKQIILPSVKGDKLELKEFVSIDNLISGESFGIGEPNGKVFKDLSKIELIVVPGIAFDHQRNRLGRGKAYYDKLLKTTKAYRIGVCFNFQMIDSIPIDEHDVKMDLIISE